VIVTIEEKTAFIDVCQQIEKMVSIKIENFRTCFPFGCPKDDLKVTIKLFNLVRSLIASLSAPFYQKLSLAIENYS
jgi:hypothetical protein